MNTISRSQFLRGDWRGEQRPVRPPWALPEPAFLAACEGCGECVSSCPENILELTARKLPYTNFSRGACSFCTACVLACPSEALRLNCREDTLPWMLRANISANCLCLNGTTCSACIESCEQDAIVAKPAMGGRTDIRVEAGACNGCGACYSVCPATAITMDSRTST